MAAVGSVGAAAIFSVVAAVPWCALCTKLVRISVAYRTVVKYGTIIARLARDQVAGTVRRRLSPNSGCRLRLFTCMPVEVPRVRIIRNDFSWLRARHPAPLLKSSADLVGTSLVESGVVKADAYMTGVESLPARFQADRYFAHRKEAEWKLDLIERMGLRVVRPALPLEIVARRGPIGRTIVSFGSTVVHTLPTVLAESDVEVVVCEIANDWYEPDATGQADEFLDRVTTSAQRGHHPMVAVAV